MSQKIPHLTVAIPRGEAGSCLAVSIGRKILDMRLSMRTALLLAAAVVIPGSVGWWMTRGPDASQFANLREPRLTHMSDQRMLVVEATGDPNVVAGSAFDLLFDSYYKVPGVSRAGRPPAPRARWPLPLNARKDLWVGRYALPLPESATAPSTGFTSPSTLRVGITTWTYGDVAEILHVGAYSTEQPDIERVNAFISSRGYRGVGDHEEEYVKGPGMIFAGNPDKYLTIIRLRVERSEVDRAKNRNSSTGLEQQAEPTRPKA
jgi:hypothetical protein